MIHLALRHWAPFLAGGKVVVFTDSTAAEAFINRQRAPSSRSLSILRNMALLAVQYDIVIQAVHIPGQYNDIADAISRLDEPGQICRLVSLVEQYCYPFPPPMGYWLPYHVIYVAKIPISSDPALVSILQELDAEMASWW